MRKTLLMGAAAFVALGVASQAGAATGFSFENLGGAEYDTIGFNIVGDAVFTGDTDDGSGTDDVTFEIWDDGTQLFSTSFAGVIGVENTFHFDEWFPGLIKQGAAGVGLYLYDNGALVLSIGNYNPPHLPDPGAIPEPATWAMLVSGFALAGAAMRTRRQRVNFA
jgi:hypothetical protein